MSYAWVWIAWGVAFVIAEVLALRTRSDGQMPLTDVIRWFMRRGLWATLAVFALWLWLGWHFFVD